MHIRNLSRKLDIDFVIGDEWPLPVHKHTFYELQYIMRGQGRHIINGITSIFKKGDLFVLAPQDTHFFIFEQRSAVCIIKFQPGFFSGQLQDKEFSTILSQLAAPLRKKISGGKNQALLIQLMDLLINQHRKPGTYQQLIIKNILALALTLTATPPTIGQAPVTDEKIQSILSYIEQHLTNKPLLKVEAISAAFHISKNYLSQYFKQETGTSYKKYVQCMTLQTIAQQLTGTHKSLKELAAEFGFTDESHLSNTFKAHFHQTPTAFRRKRI